jgi:guanine deaminase
MGMNRRFLDHAIRLGEFHMQAGAGGPFGAVVVKNERIIAEGWNEVPNACDPTAHAEIVAIRRACRALADFSLRGASLYCTCEPCPMCLGAIYWARLDAVYFAAELRDVIQIGFDDAFIYEELTKPWSERRIECDQAARDDALRVFAAWRRKPDKVMY